MQHDRPTPQELAEAVREFLQDEILPILDDPEQPTVRTGHDVTPISLPKRSIQRGRKTKSSTPKFKSRWILGAIVAGVGFGLLVVIFFIVKFLAATKG